MADTAWTKVIVPRREFHFPDLCPGCLRPKPRSVMRLASERSRLLAFYLFAAKREYLYINVPFCNDCAKRRKRWEHWENRDIVLLLLATFVTFGFAGVLAATLGLEPWLFWVIFVAVAAIATFLLNRIGPDNRFVRINCYDDDTIGEPRVPAMQPCPLQKKINKFRGTPSTGRPSGPASEVASRVESVRGCRSQ
jgi:hypothetical protein